MNPRILIAGTKSGVGKTTITIGLMSALKDKGKNVQPFKVGPDYIDPGFHTKVTGNRSRNLDSYLLEPKTIKESFLNASTKKDISIIEGVMGLYDGKHGGKESGAGSSAEIAKILDTPVILVLDAGKMAQSAGAMIKGYREYDKQVNIAGVILNNVASERHYQMIKNSVKKDIEFLGHLPWNEELELPERHLGLVPTYESEDLDQYIQELSRYISKHIDLKLLMEIAENTKDIDIDSWSVYRQKPKYNLKVGVAFDEAFNFYYYDNLDILEELGGEIKEFSPINDEKLPEVDALYIGGGFPETFLPELEQNKKMKESIREFHQKNKPIYAECGGLAYLSNEITDFDGAKYNMVGIVPGEVSMTDELQAMGYVEALATENNILMNKNEKTKGHEFHYSKIEGLKKKNSSYTLKGGKGADGRHEGYTEKNLLASYVHLHFATNPKIPGNFLKKTSEIKKQQNNQASK
ncbi:cobyrinate a,c-diamide synthase [Methanonatronarchaeum sp. AMET6-2]|uniref:cobyrinate a,c-diamide synthase n=1 Tax=Methanonatronarchaeum sp. AMET6-2 TaxID=2933293 RepID=UPI001FF66047|nr:cobyrinate a,c-diamide synthase [Methanonatronarchaeum sp. AMET6-2]UOY10507.1 hydrogenobyrinic acid a,c-diamide synthase (glutamine-hydrolyzing) [Methanonatronarchaeum sp. AMET6-2]